MSDTAPHYVVICIGTTGDIHPFMRIGECQGHAHWQHPGASLVAHERAAGDRPLLFTHGTGNLFAKAFFATALAAAVALGRRAIFLTRERDQVPAQLPESVLWQPYVPLSGLLPQVAGRFTPQHDPVALCAEIERRVSMMPALADAA